MLSFLPLEEPGQSILDRVHKHRMDLWTLSPRLDIFCTGTYCDECVIVPSLEVVFSAGAAHQESSPQCFVYFFYVYFCTIPFTL